MTTKTKPQPRSGAACSATWQGEGPGGKHILAGRVQQRIAVGVLWYDEDEAPAKKRRGLFGRAKGKAQPATTTTTQSGYSSSGSRSAFYADDDEDEAPAKKRRSLFGRGKEKAPATSASSQSGYSSSGSRSAFYGDDEDETPAKKRRSLFGRGKEKAQPAASMSSRSAFYAADDENKAPAKKRRGLLGRGKDKAPPAASASSRTSSAMSAFYDEDEAPAEKKRGLFRRGDKARGFRRDRPPAPGALFQRPAPQGAVPPRRPRNPVPRRARPALSTWTTWKRSWTTCLTTQTRSTTSWGPIASASGTTTTIVERHPTTRDECFLDLCSRL